MRDVTGTHDAAPSRTDSPEDQRDKPERQDDTPAPVLGPDALRALVAHLPGAAAFVVDHDLRYLLAEGQALRAAGLAPADLVGKTIFEALEPSLAAAYEPLYRRALAGREFVHEHEAHGRVYVSRGVPLRDEAGEGRVYGALALSYDITDRRRAEAELRASEERHRFLLALNDRLAPLTDPDAIEHEATRLLGEFLGASRVGYAKILPDGRTSLVTRNYTSGVRSIEGSHRVADYSPALLEALEAGRTVARGDVADDPALTAAEQASRAKSEFLAVMSHELRTPLNAIGGYAELLELGIHGPVTDPQREAISRIQRSERHLLGLINDILNFAKLEAGRVEYRIADVSVRAVIDELELLVAPQMRAKALRFARGECADGRVLRADPEKLQQILVNLLSNAIKFTATGGAIALRSETAGDRVLIAVEDTGVGIPRDRLEQVFAPFVQVDRRLNAPHEGTGLGLAISRELARGMGGDVTAQSTVGAGSTFTVTLPRA